MNQTATSQEGLLIGAGERVARIDKVGPIGLLFGVIGIVGCIVAYAGGYPIDIAGSWMFAWYFWISITLGMFALAILGHTIRATWLVSLLRLFEAGGGPVSIAVMGVLFLPIWLHPSSIYAWADPSKVAQDPILQFKAPYLNQPAWMIRTAVYFAIWIAFSWGLRHSTRTQERLLETEDAGLNKRREMGRSSWGAAGIVLFFVSFTFADIDWVMSLEPHWYSTMFGLWQIIASALGALAFCVVMACINAKREPFTEIISPNLTKDWGNMLFCITMLWAYTALSQYLIIWNGNLPDTAQYYATRARLMWNAVGMAVIAGQFLVPWMTLLSPRVKRYPYLLQKIAGWIFVIHIVDTYLAVCPAIPVSHPAAGLEHRWAGYGYFGFDLLAFLAVGGIWLYTFASQVKTAPLLVKYDHRLQEALHSAH